MNSNQALKKMANIEAMTHIKLADRAYVRCMNVKSRGDKQVILQEALLHFSAAVDYLELIDSGNDKDRKSLLGRLEKLLWSMAENAGMEFIFACNSPIQEHLPNIQSIELASTLFGLVERAKDIVRCHEELILICEKSERLGFELEVYGPNCLGTDGLSTVNVLRSSVQEKTEWIAENESKIKSFVESHLINPDNIPLKTAYQNLIREHVLAGYENQGKITRVEIEIDLEKDNYEYMVYRGELGRGSGGKISTLWKTLLDDKRIDRALSLPSARLSNEFANIAGQYDVMCDLADK